VSKIQSVGEGTAGGGGEACRVIVEVRGIGREGGNRHYDYVRLAGQCKDGVGGAEDVIGPWDKETAR